MKFLIAFSFLIPSMILAAPSSSYIQKNAIETASEIKAEIVSELTKYRIVSLGEVHGNDQSPALAGDIAEALAKSREIILALEIKQANQYGLDEFSKSGDKNILRLLAHFAREYQDGRSSIAMVELLAKVRKNPRIQVVAFDPDVDSGGADRDLEMAKNILKIVKAAPNKRVVVLTGNFHSSVKIGNPFAPKFKPMAFWLSRLAGSPLKPPEVFAIRIRHEKATSWICRDDTAESCGLVELAVDTSAYAKAVEFERYFLKEPALSEEGYHASFFIRSLEVSPPFKPMDLKGAALMFERFVKIESETKFTVFRSGRISQENPDQMEMDSPYCAIENHKLKSLTFKKGQRMAAALRKLSFPNEQVRRFQIFEDSSYGVFCDFTGVKEFAESKIVAEVNTQFAGSVKLAE